MSRMGRLWYGGAMRITSAEFVVSAAAADQFPRDGLPEVAFAGRSNVGKSSLINRLLGRRDLARTSSTPGRTRLINFYRVNGGLYFVDLPGYGYARVPRGMREAWGELVEGYLASREALVGVVWIVDARHPPMPADREMREFLEGIRRPALVVLTKADKVPPGQRRAMRERAALALGLADPSAPIAFSAVTGEGVRELWAALDEGLRAAPRRRS